MSDNREAARRQFGERAENYRMSRTHGDQAVLERIIEFIAPEGRGKAADIGSGGGHMAVTLARWVDELVAVDMTPQMLTQTGILASQRGLSNMVRCLADAQNLPLRSEVFDIVTCRSVLHHVPDYQRWGAYFERVVSSSSPTWSVLRVCLEDEGASRYITRLRGLETRRT